MQCGRRELVAATAGEVPGVSWALVTAPDEQVRCCVVIDGARCEQPSAFLLEGADRSWDDYTYVCGGHLQLVRKPGDREVPISALLQLQVSENS